MNRKEDFLDKKGMEIMEVHPVVLGGSPIDDSNKIAVPRNKHIELVRYWNRVIKGLRK